MKSDKTYKAAGVAIPIFSIRSQDSWGIGEFFDVKKLADWAHITKQTYIQVLPINDTTMNYTKADSYPYNAISIYALHPVYLGLHEFPLKDENLYQKYKQEATKLNALPAVDYDSVIKLKTAYLADLFAEIGQEILKDSDFLAFRKKNEEWLFPYACFSYLRDLNKISKMSKWKAHQKYNKQELENAIASDSDMHNAVDQRYFVQYLLHKQLTAAKAYANSKGVKLKGDIPIGINPNSVEAWTEPHLFNLDTQTGAPPDDFAVNGQNWGFPTYNWDEMAKDGYQWWIKRFRKMADYFDAYRIDHLLGFFRIWEIPGTSVHGLLGYFSPALPLTPEEITKAGLKFDEDTMAKAYITEAILEKKFGEDAKEVAEKFLNKTDSGRFEFKKEFDTQHKIREHFGETTDEKSIKIRDTLYLLSQDLLFVHDKKEPTKFHPRIAAEKTDSYKDLLSEEEQKAYDDLSKEFFEERHTEFWREEAMKKLPPLLKSTDMLACGEDLGMVPKSVASVMKELEIISLEIERMPKTPKVNWEPLDKLPYLSVCTTSSHDINPVRAWWLEDRKSTEKYYKTVLKREGEAPEQCTTEICHQILMNHLNSPSILAILPLQDWLSVDEKLRNEDPEAERINIPSVPDHYWRYRMHLNLEDLIKADEFNKEVTSMVQTSGRAH